MTKFYTLSKQSLRAIMANKGRSFLTVLGIVIGIGSVIALVSLGEGANKIVSNQIRELGATTLTVIPGSSFGPGFGENKEDRDGHPRFNPAAVSTLTLSDLEDLQDRSAHPSIESAVGVITSIAVVQNNDIQKQFNINGVSPKFFDLLNFKIARGRNFNEQDMQDRKRVVILGNDATLEIFAQEDPIGKTILVRDREFEIVGVIAETPASQFDNPNEYTYIPLTTSMDLFNAANLNMIVVSAENEDAINRAIEDIKSTLLANHGITNEKLADFTILSPEDLLATVDQITSLLTSLLAGIAGISLVVGGIGIMNIMLVAVTERTREIGLRKAVGAKTRDIMIQFLIEAVLLTIIGAILGILAGIAIGELVAGFIGLDPIITFGSIALAVGVSSVIGITFGLYPAAKAARLNPIEALRYE